MNKIISFSDSSGSSGSLGNTKPNSKQCSPAVRWCFTLNNYSEEIYIHIQEVIKAKAKRAIIGKEKGEKGTPHLQGYIEWKKKCRPKNVINVKEIHWEKSKGSKDQNDEYCKKEGIFWEWPEKFIINIPELHYWEKAIVDILSEKADDRTIHWYWSREGCMGKTTFQKWIFLNYEKVIILGGKSADMKNGIVDYQKKNDDLPKIVLINIPRINGNYINVEGLESIKDMFFYSGKYEGGMVCGPNPHVFVFANEKPNMDLMSNDRWRITEISNE